MVTMTSPITAKKQTTPYETTVVESKKRSLSPIFNKKDVKRTNNLWTKQEVTIITNILNTSFPDSSINSMKGKWRILTDQFNQETNLFKTVSQVYKKVSHMLTEQKKLIYLQK
jgi:hypothetical protein